MLNIIQNDFKTSETTFLDEIVSILKNMSLCGLPVKKVWRTVKKALSKYTNELPTDSTN